MCLVYGPIDKWSKSSALQAGVTGSNPVGTTIWCCSIVANAPDCLSGYHGFESHQHRHGFFETENFPLSFPYPGESYPLSSHHPMVEWRNRQTRQS